MTRAINSLRLYSQSKFGHYHSFDKKIIGRETEKIAIDLWVSEDGRRCIHYSFAEYERRGIELFQHRRCFFSEFDFVVAEYGKKEKPRPTTFTASRNPENPAIPFAPIESMVGYDSGQSHEGKLILAGEVG